MKTSYTFKEYTVLWSLKLNSESFPVTIKWTERLSSWVTEEEGNTLLRQVILGTCFSNWCTCRVTHLRCKRNYGLPTPSSHFAGTNENNILFFSFSSLPSCLHFSLPQLLIQPISYYVSRVVLDSRDKTGMRIPVPLDIPIKSIYCDLECKFCMIFKSKIRKLQRVLVQDIISQLK